MSSSICVINIPNCFVPFHFPIDNTTLGRHTLGYCWLFLSQTYSFCFSLCKGHVLALWNPCSKWWMIHEVKSLFAQGTVEYRKCCLHCWAEHLCTGVTDSLRSRCTASKSLELSTWWQAPSRRKAESCIYWPPKSPSGTVILLLSLQVGLFPCNFSKERRIGIHSLSPECVEKLTRSWACDTGRLGKEVGSCQYSAG